MTSSPVSSALDTLDEQCRVFLTFCSQTEGISVSMCCPAKVKTVGGRFLGGTVDTTPGDVRERGLYRMDSPCYQTLHMPVGEGNNGVS